MLEALNDVLEAEERADREIAEAKQEATRVRSSFSEEESAAVRDAQTAADRLVRERIAAVREEQDLRVDATGERLLAESRDFVPEDAEGFEQAVSAAARVVSAGPEQETA